MNTTVSANDEFCACNGSSDSLSGDGDPCNLFMELVIRVSRGLGTNGGTLDDMGGNNTAGQDGVYGRRDKNGWELFRGTSAGTCEYFFGGGETGASVIGKRCGYHLVGSIAVAKSE